LFYPPLYVIALGHGSSQFTLKCYIFVWHFVLSQLFQEYKLILLFASLLEASFLTYLIPFSISDYPHINSLYPFFYYLAEIVFSNLSRLVLHVFIFSAVFYFLSVTDCNCNFKAILFYSLAYVTINNACFVLFNDMVYCCIAHTICEICKGWNTCLYSSFVACSYGSFFGPSQPVIAQRVIQESKSLLENGHLVPRPSNSPQIVCIHYLCFYTFLLILVYQFLCDIVIVICQSFPVLLLIYTVEFFKCDLVW
jgi:hypothetical protein